MKQIVTKGIVLARTDFGETDRILTVLTHDQGKIRAIAKGVRKVKSKLAGGIELFSISQLTYIQGKTDIYTLTSTRLDKHFGNIVKDIDRTMFAYDVLKNINRITEDNTDSDYFDLLVETLTALDNYKIDLPLIQFWINLQLLKLAGNSPNLQTDAESKKLQSDKKYNFDISKMSFTEQSRGSFDSRHIKLLRLSFGLDSPAPLAKINDIQAILPNCLQLSKLMLKQN